MFEPSEDGIAWVDGIPEYTGGIIPIWSPRPGRPIYAILLGGEFCTVATHHLNSRTVPCRKNREECVGCGLGIPARNKMYLPGYNLRYQKRGLVELTPFAVKEYFGAGLSPAFPRRGLGITVTRQGRTAQSPVNFRLEVGKVNVDGLPPAFDMREALQAIWNAPGRAKKRKDEGDANAIPV